MQFNNSTIGTVVQGFPATAMEMVAETHMFMKAQQYGITVAAVRAIVEKFGGIGLPPEELLPFLDSWIKREKVERDRRGHEPYADQALSNARLEAQRSFDEGRLDDASAAFMDQFEQEERAEHQRQRARGHIRRLLLEEAIDYDRRALNGDAAARKLQRLAQLEYPGQHFEQLMFVGRRACDQLRMGESSGDMGALLVAIAAFRMMATPWLRGPHLDIWVGIQQSIGLALRILGERQTGLATLRDAELAYRTALRDLQPAKSAHEWAACQSGLGSVLGRIGERESNPASVRLAVKAFRAALTIRTRQVDGRVGTLSNLGVALHELGDLTGDVRYVRCSIVAFRLALRDFGAAVDPALLASVRQNLANSLRDVGRRERNPMRFSEAITLYRSVDTELLKTKQPMIWAGAKNGIALTLTEVAETDADSALLAETIAALDDVLTVWTRDKAPVLWAKAIINRGRALYALGERASGTGELVDSIRDIRSGLEVLTVDCHRVKGLISLSVSLELFAKRTGDFDLFRQSEEILRAALVCSRGLARSDYADALSNLCRVLCHIGLRQSGTEKLDEALVIGEECIAEFEQMGMNERARNLSRTCQQIRQEIRRRLPRSTLI